jgi:hypothetical protein
MALAIPIITEFDGKGIGSAIREFKNLETASDKIGFAAKNAAKVAAVGFAALAAAGAAVGTVLFKAAQAAAEDQAAQVKLASQIKATSDATDVQIKGVEDYIDQTQRAVGVADDKLRPAFGRLIAATKDTTKAQDLLNIALNVSAATGKDVEAVAGALAKAQEGNFTALDRLGIGYEKGEAKARGFLGVQKDLEERFSGAAATRANTYEGVMDRLKITLGELQESIGYKVLPIIQELTEAALLIAEAFGKDGAAGGIKQLQISLIELGTGSDGMINTFGKIYNAIVGFSNGVMNALAIPLATINFLRTGELGTYTIKKIPDFATMMATQNASQGTTSARQFESAMPRPITTGGGTGGGAAITPGNIVPTFDQLNPRGPSGTGTNTMAGGLAGITINLEAGLISSPGTIGQDIIDAILAAQRDSGVVFAPAVTL